MQITEWIVFGVGVIVVLAYISISTNIRNKKKIYQKLKNSWGAVPKNRNSYEEYERMSKLFYKTLQKNKNLNAVDDITWNDLSMDEVFGLINNTNSSVGQEYLYRMLRTPESNDEILKERDRLAEYFTENEDDRINVQKKFVALGYARNVSVSDYIDIIMDLEPESSLLDILCNVLIVASLVYCIGFNPSLGIILVIGAMGFAIIDYYKKKAKVENYYSCVKLIVRMINCSEDISDLKVSGLDKYNPKLKGFAKTFASIRRNSSLLAGTGAGSGSIAEIFIDYFCMITHWDLMKFNSMVRLLSDRQEDITDMFDTLGTIESSIAIGSFRQLMPYYCKPEFVYNSKVVDVVNLYHPLISEPVANSISVDKAVLLTGSNASGKSTFLKTVAINAILSQTIYTSVSERYRGSFFRIMTSMALQDNLSGSESYFMVEIKSLKRIVDSIKNSEQPVLCFIDEVLRGTNTIERISASSQILKSMSCGNSLCFAATHDIELTYILEKCYNNFHFQEDISDNDIHFNYTLFDGRATNRNAIKLLGIIGYEDKIIKASEDMAETFIKSGEWEKL